MIEINQKIKSWKLKTSKDTPSFQENQAVKRPVSLKCDIHRVKIKGETWTMLVGLLDEKPYEVFGGLSKYIDIPAKCKQGLLIKNGKINGVSSYNLSIGEGDDCILIKDIVSVFENPNYGAFTRTISLALRHGTAVQFVVEQLQKDKYSDITSFSNVVARVLKQYIKDGIKPTSKSICPECKEENSLIYQEGCMTCQKCFYSKCG